MTYFLFYIDKGLLFLFFFIFFPVLHLFSQENLVKNGSMEQLGNFNSYTTVFQGGNSEVILQNDTFMFSGLASRNFAHVISSYWNYDTDTSEMRVANAYYSDKGLAHSGNVFKIIHVFDFEYSKNEISLNRIAGTLCKQLIKGHDYRIQFYLKPFSGNYFTSNICVGFSSEAQPLSITIDKASKIPKHSQNIAPAWCLPKILSDTSAYTLYEFNYTANGNEQFIFIGNLRFNTVNFWSKKNWKETFQKSKQYGYWKNTQNAFMCVYAIDDVRIIPITDSLEYCEMEYTKTNEHAKVLSDTLLFQTIWFERNQFQCADSVLHSFINSLYLSKEKINSLLLVGHTDIQGSETFNEHLAWQRANFIAENLKIFFDVPITIISKGSAQPLLFGEDADNRRVEIFIEEKK